MKPNCLFSRLDRLNYQNGYYRVQMGLTEDILWSVSLFLRRFDEVNAAVRPRVRRTRLTKAIRFATCTLTKTSPVILERGTVERLLKISSLSLGKNIALCWIKLTKHNFWVLSLYDKEISKQILDPNCCLLGVPIEWNINSQLSSEYLHCNRQNRQESWQTYRTFSYQNV